MTADDKPSALPSFETAFQPLTVSQPPEHVTIIQDGLVQLFREDVMPYRYDTDEKLVQLVADHIDRNVAFVEAGPGWHPGAVIRSLQECGLVTKGFIGIAWHGTGLFRTYEVAFRPSA